MAWPALYKLHSHAFQKAREGFLLISCLNSCSGNTYFTVLGQGKVYHQGSIAEEHCHRTAFITPWGLYQWNHILFGLKNAPATYQRYMENCLKGYHSTVLQPGDCVLVRNWRTREASLTLGRTDTHYWDTKSRQSRLLGVARRWMRQTESATP